MKPVCLGAVQLNGIPVLVQEYPVDGSQPEPAEGFRVELVLANGRAMAGLQDIRALKQLLARAETRLLLREEQALRSQNLNLDLG